MKSLELIFSNPRGPTHALGSLSQLYFVGSDLREFANGPPMATEQNSRWVTSEGAYSRFDCDHPTTVTLQMADGETSPTYGPFRSFSGFNGIKYSDHQLFCYRDEQTQDFYGYDSKRHWDSVLIVPA